MSDHTYLTVEDLFEITQMVWESFLNPTGDELAGQLRPPSATTATDEVSAAVAVTGAWQGHIVVSCSMAAAREISALLLEIPLPEVSESDVADALGELANIIGGNVKGLLPRPCALSLPYLVVAASEHVRWPSATVESRLLADWHDEPIVVTVLKGSRDENERTGAT
jgi:chemotaxis protein CheX